MKAGWAVAASFLVLVGCGQVAKHESDTLVIARAADAVSLDPAISMGSGDGTIINLCYQTLTAIDPRSADGTAVGRLAQSWTNSPDGMTWEFHLRPDAKFNDGTPVTAEAVAYSLKRVLKINRAPAQGLFWMKAVDALDAHTVHFVLNIPFPVLPKILTLTSAAVVNPALVAAHQRSGDEGQAWLSEHCAGSGPYTVKSWQRGQRLSLQRTPNGAGAYFATVAFKVVPDESSRRLQIAKGDVDFIDTIGAATADRYADISGVVLDTIESHNVLTYLTLNTQRPALSDGRVRHAIADSIDYRALREKVLDGHVTLLNGLIPPGVPGYDPSLPEPRRNIGEAKALLAEAGYANGLSLSMVVGQTGPVAEMIQSNLADVGIHVTLQRLAPSALDDARVSGTFDVFYDGWVMDFPDPFIFLNLAFSTPQDGGVGNFSHYRNPAAQQLLNAAMVTADPQKRAALYRQAQTVILKDQPIVMLFAPKTIMARRSTLTHVLINPYQPNYLDIAAMGRD